MFGFNEGRCELHAVHLFHTWFSCNNMLPHMRPPWPNNPKSHTGWVLSTKPWLRHSPGAKGATADFKKVIIDCGKELNRDGEFNAMIINLTLLSIAMDELNDKNKPCLTQMRVIEHWWDGIGKWKA